jgi:hypothetical protein
LRAITSIGTQVETNSVTLELAPDTRLFQIDSTNPLDGATRGRSLQMVDIHFSKRPDPSTVVPTNFMILDGNDQRVAFNDVTVRTDQQQDDTVRLSFDTLPDGEYRVVIRSSAVTDRYGNSLGVADFVSHFSRRPIMIDTVEDDSALPGIQVVESTARTFDVTLLESLPLVVTQAELLLDGEAIETNADLPLSYSIGIPRVADKAGSFTLQVRVTGDDATMIHSNLLSVDLLPRIRLASSAIDMDPATPGIQVTELTTIPLDTHLRAFAIFTSAELIVNGEVAQTHAFLPPRYDFSVPVFDPQSPSVNIEIRATNHKGLSFSSDILTFDIVNDTTPPTIESISPANEERVATELDAAVIQFSEPIAVGTVTPANFMLRDGAGNVLPLTSVAFEPSSDDKTVRLEFDTLAAGDYQISIQASAVTDLAGNPIGATNITTTFSIVRPPFVWTNAAGGNWTDAPNWDGNEVPGPADDVIIDAPDSLIIAAGDISVNDLDLRSGDLAVTSDFTVNGEFLLSGDGAVRGPGFFVINGTGTWTGGTLGVFNDPHTARINGTLTISGDLLTKVIDRRTIDNAGTVTWNAALADPLVPSIHATRQAVWNNLPGSLFDVRVDGSFFGNDAGTEPAVFNNAGTIRKSAGTGTTKLSLSVVNTGTIDVQVGTLVSEVAAGHSTTSTGAFSVAAGAAIVLGGEQTLSDTSSVAGDGNVTLAGATTINGTYDVHGSTRIAGSSTDQISFSATPADLGASVILASGQLHIAGDYVQTGAEALNVAIGRLGGNDSGGSLVATGQAQLAGVLDVSLVEGYVPVIGDSFPILTYDSRVGQFATINGLDLGDGKILVATYNATNLALEVVSGSGLRLAGETQPMAVGTELLDRAALVPLLEQTRARWIAAGAEGSQLDAISIRLADLPGNLLGYASQNVVWLDYSAAGHGWYIASVNSDDDLGPAADGIDLLMALSHELGHLLGLEHTDATGSLMSESLAPGLHFRPWFELVDELFVEN